MTPKQEKALIEAVVLLLDSQLEILEFGLSASSAPSTDPSLDHFGLTDADRTGLRNSVDEIRKLRETLEEE